MSKHTNLINGLSTAIGSTNVIADPISLSVYECDGATLFKALPDVVVFPDTTKDVSKIVKIANEYQVPFVARGSGTGLSGGALPTNGGVVIAMNRMNRILEVDFENQQATIETGVVNLLLSQATLNQGYHYAPDPSSQQACSIGGNIAENSGGPHTLKYGVTSNHILWLEVVLPNGEIVEFGSPTEESIGYDLRGLMVGSEGTFGIATKAVVRLTRNPQSYYTMLGIFNTVVDATSAVSQIIAEGIVPAALEVMDHLVIKAVEEAFQWGLPLDAGAVLIVELDGIEAGMQRQAERIIDILNRNQARGVQTAKDEADRKQLWTARKRAFGALGRLAPTYITQDGTVPRSQLPKMMALVGEVSKKYDLDIANVFHAGDGNLHPIVLFDQRNPDQLERVHLANAEILKACVEAGGTISGEHGIGVEKQQFMPLVYSRADMELMVKIRETFNPHSLCNPGKIFPIDQFGDETRWHQEKHTNCSPAIEQKERIAS